MKYTNIFTKKALLAIFAMAALAFTFTPTAFADVFAPDYTYSTFSPDYSYSTFSQDQTYSTYSPDYLYSTYSPDYSYSTYSPDYSYSTYSPDYSYSTYSPDTYSVAYVGTSYTGTSYDYPSYVYGTSYAGSGGYYGGTSYSTPIYGTSYSGYGYNGGYTYANYNNNASYSTSNLTATCYPSISNPSVNSNVTWIVNATGGNGSYSYLWSGTDGIEGLTTSNPTVFYNSNGSKYASVRVISNGQTINVSCGSTYVGGSNNGGIVASCYPNVNSAGVGQNVTWTASVSGGNGAYTYSWSDNDGINSTGYNGPTFTTSYAYPGTKAPQLTVYPVGYPNGNTQRVYCNSVTILGNGYYANYGYNYPVVGNLASVSLSQVPYTGITDSASFWGFMLGLVLASILGAWYLTKVYSRGKRSHMVKLFKEANLARKLA